MRIQETAEQKKSQVLMGEVGQTRLRNLLHFYSKDLQVPVESAKTTIRSAPVGWVGQTLVGTL